MTGVMCSNMLSNEAGSVAIGNSGGCVRGEGLIGNVLPREAGVYRHGCGKGCTMIDRRRPLAGAVWGRTLADMSDRNGCF